MISQNEIDFILYLGGTLFALGILLSLLAHFTGVKSDSLQKRIENVLPGMNCGQCGYPGCSAFATALAAGKASANACHPGGPDIAQELAAVLGVSTPEGLNYDEMLFNPRLVAFIHSSECNGCGKCKKHCRVDAIEGTIKNAHCINVEECIGCGDCVKDCPQQCIEMVRLETGVQQFDWNIKSVNTNVRGK